MRRNNKKILLGIILLLITITSGFLMFNKKEEYKELPKVKIKEQYNKKQFALMLEKTKGSGDYQESDGELPTEGYVFNKEKSSCTDINGKKIDGILDYDYENYIALLDTSKTSYCYLYYDIEPNISYLRSKDTDNHISKELTGGMYRYQGLYTDDVRNYICLGENCCNTEECSADTNDSMYRIIGINAKGELKVIKKTSLTDSIKWWNDNKTNIKWPQSLIYQKLNGKSDGNLTIPNLNDSNSYYYSLDNKLKDLIINNHSWLYGDTTSNGGYNGDIMYGIESGNSDSTIYMNEDIDNNPTGKYKWNERIEAPLGLMYISDYYYAYRTNEIDAGKPGDINSKNSWINIGNNEKSHSVNNVFKNGSEWTISRRGFSPNDYPYRAWGIYVNGNESFVSFYINNDAFAIRPTLFITNDIELTGDGTLSNPFRIF